ncbi:MAG: lysophospholipid acyltransferase family protein [Chloroflexota bacterium]
MTQASDGRRPDLWTRMVAVSNRLLLSYWLIVSGSAVARFLPLRLSYAVASAIGDLVFYTWADKRRAAIANMRQVLGPPAEKRAVWVAARQSYRNYLKYTVDFLRFPGLSPEMIKSKAVMEGRHHLDEALAAGKGVIFVSMHFGHFDMGAAYLALSGYPVNAVVDTFEPAKLNELIQRQRSDKGVKLVPIEVAGRAVLRVLRRNEILGLLVDRPMPGEGVRVDFFGAPIEVPAGAATLAIKTGARILPGYILRVANDAFQGVILPGIEFRPSGDLRSDVTALTQQMMHELERGIRAYPEQWYMFRHMWAESSLHSAAGS